MSSAARSTTALLEDQDAQVAVIEQAAVATILSAYIALYEAVLDELEALLDQTRNRTYTRAEAARIRELVVLVERVEAGVSAIVADADPRITAAQRELVDLGEQHARQRILLSLEQSRRPARPLRPVPTTATEEMIGFLQPGMPLRDALDRLPGMAGDQVRRTLIEGITDGRNPRTVARQFREALGGNAVSAERLARTAQLQAYRNSLHATYRANPQTVRKWRWTAHMDDRTCMSCIVMHGTIHEPEETLVDHWNGRCTPTPLTHGWEEVFGERGQTIPDPSRDVETGIQWFARQPVTIQQRMLGRSKYAAWQAGKIELPQLSKVVTDPVWGRMRVEPSLRDLLGAEEARKWYGIREETP